MPPSPSAELAAVDRDDRHDLADRRARERLVCGEQLRHGERSLADAVAGRARDRGRRPRDAREDAGVERRGEEDVAVPPPDVRDRRLEHGLALGEEDRVVGSVPLCLGLGRHVTRVARRLDAGQQPGVGRRTVTRRGRVLAALSRPGGIGATVATSVIAGPVEAQRGVGGAGGLDRAGERARTRAVGRRQPEAAADARAARRAAEEERPPAVDPRRLERGAPAQQRLVARAEDRRVRIDEPAPATATASSFHAATSPPTAASSGRALTQDSSISASASESQTIPPPTQRCTRPSATANVRIVSARSKSPFGRSVAERAHRRAAADRLERGDQVDARRSSARRSPSRPGRPR